MLLLLLPALIILDPRVPEAVPVAAPDVERMPELPGVEKWSTDQEINLRCRAQVFPTISYPQFHTTGNKREADCENTIFINRDGTIDVLTVVCTDPDFEAAVRNGLATMRWQSHHSDGTPCPEIGTEMSYPVTFRLE